MKYARRPYRPVGPISAEASAAADAAMRRAGLNFGPVSSRARVYFIRRVDGGPIKIGTSLSPEVRRVSLQEGSPVRLEIVATIPGDRREEERHHARFAAHRLHGEWFAPAPELLEFIESLKEKA